MTRLDVGSCALASALRNNNARMILKRIVRAVFFICSSLVKNHVGTAAPGCPVERSSTIHCLKRISGASLRRAAEGGCPHVILAPSIGAHRTVLDEALKILLEPAMGKLGAEDLVLAEKQEESGREDASDRNGFRTRTPSVQTQA